MEIEDWIARQRKKMVAYEVEAKKIKLGDPKREEKIIALIEKLGYIYGL